MLGILYANSVTTVSPNHADEALYADGASGLGRARKEHQDKPRGVLNGADYDAWTPRPTRTWRRITRSRTWSASARIKRRSGTGSGCVRPSATGWCRSLRQRISHAMNVTAIHSVCHEYATACDQLIELAHC